MRIVVVAVALCVATGALGAQAKPDWAELYRQAIDDVERADWKAAESKLLTAIKFGPTPARSVIRRGLFGRDDYFPQFYLGIVFLNTNRAPEARVQFQMARKLNINLRKREFERLPEYEAKAREVVAPPPPRPATPDSAQQFRTLMDQAQRSLAASRYDEAENAAKQARALNVDNDAVAAMLQNVARSRASARIQQALKGTPSMADLRRLLAEYGDSGAPLDEVRKRLAAGEAIERRAVAERAGMIAFYRGNYAQALTALAEAEKASTLSGRGQFYRAVALASQATRGKVVNQTLLRDARRAWVTANERSNEFRADLRYISPQILQLLREP